MKIRVYEGNSGDCVQIVSAEGKNILVDGGLVKTVGGKVESYQHNVAPELSRMRGRGERLDLVCVSHVDQDHIGGILTMLNDEFAWRVHEHQTDQGLNPPEPENPRPPQVEKIWHNSFKEQVGSTHDELEVALEAASAHAYATGTATFSHGRELFGQLATSMKEAAQVSRRIGASQLAIPLNPEFNGKLVRRHNLSGPLTIGDLTITVLGPTTERLKELHEKWQKWLRSKKGEKQIGDVKRDAEDDEKLLENQQIGDLFALHDLGPDVGNPNSVSEQNVASIVMMVEEDGKRVLLTGDARHDHIHEDLVDCGLTDDEGHIHVDVLKVQHHGSEHNWSAGFGRLVTADHYLFCGNGGHHNPDIRVVRELLDARVGGPSKRSPHVDPDRPFKIWFTSDGTTFKADEAHMRKVRELVERRLADHSHASAHFSNDAFFDVDLD